MLPNPPRLMFTRTGVLLPKVVLPRVRLDELPDRTDYADTGCTFFASCLRCPLARCIEEEPVRWTPLMLTNARRDREIALLRSKHRAPVAMLAEAYGLTRRHVYRILGEQGVSRRSRTSQAGGGKQEAGGLKPEAGGLKPEAGA